MTRPLVLISNDDGVHAEGLHALATAVAEVADIVVVAPLTEQSAGSHSLTLARPLRHRVFGEFHSVDGTPADCVYVALYGKTFLPRWPDMVISGINHGFNLGTDTFYSGTVAAAREAAFRGIPSIAFSKGRANDFTKASQCAARLVESFLKKKNEPLAAPLLNVNFPVDGDYKGWRVTKLGRRRYDDEVVLRNDPRGREYFWIGGPNAYHDEMEGSDTDAVDAGYISLTPLELDQTRKHDLSFAQILIDEMPS